MGLAFGGRADVTPHPIDPRDPVLDYDFVLDLVRQHVPSAKGVTEVDETGGEGRTYAIDADLILKTQRPHKVRPRTSLEKEAWHLRALAREAPEVSVPRVLGYGRQDGVEYMLMTRLPGVCVKAAQVEGSVRDALLQAVGATLRRMHALPLQPFVDSGLFPGDAGPSEIRHRMEDELQESVEAARGIDLGIDAEAIRRQALDLLGSATSASVPLHSNPGPEHVFVTREARLSGIIDFGDAYLSHPAFDLRRWVGLDDMKALLAGYGTVSEGFLAEWLGIALSGFLYDAAVRARRREQGLQGLRALQAARDELLG